jgi:hypothetical protein
MILECEIRLGGKWETADIDDALSSHAGSEMRCIECHGPLCAHKKYSNGTPAHFEHLKAHSGCSKIASSFAPPKSLHPDALK